MTINVNCFIPEDCNESFFYDKHGNITGIWRQGQEGVYHIDNLSFQYNGNQIKKITDHANSQNSYSVKEYQDLADEQTEFFYDANGNLITDLDRDIVTIRYNLLNLPDTIQFKNGRQIINRYDATGQKLSTMYVTPIYPLSAPLTAGATISTDNSSFRRYGTLYNANVEYTLAYNGNRTLARIHNAEGYALPSNILFYHRKDHLGSIRSLWSTNYNYDDRYYPSGLPWGNDTGYDVGPYKHNGCEFIETHGYDVTDHGNRGLYHAINRYTTIDRFAEKTPWQSPYVHAANNPVNYVDVNGDSITYIINYTITNPDGTTRISSSSYYYGQDVDGTYGFIGSNGQIYSGSNTYLSSLTTALDNLRTGGNIGNALVNDLMNSTNTVQVVQGSNAADPNGTYIRWNPNSTTGGINAMGNENRPSYIGLGHEMAHIQDTWNGTIDNSTWVTVGEIAIPNSEKYATHIENKLRAENNIPLRTHYGIDASTGTRIGLESTRIVRGGTSLFYRQSNGVAPNGIPLLSTSFIYRRK